MGEPAILMGERIALQVLMGTDDEAQVFAYPALAELADHVQGEGFFVSHGVS